MVTAVAAPLPRKQRQRNNDRRRRRPRLPISLPAHLRPFDPKYVHLEEVQTTLNFNRDGLYFATSAEHYCLGMRVLVTLPYRSANCVRKRYLGKVVRLKLLSDGRRGVALQFVF